MRGRRIVAFAAAVLVAIFQLTSERSSTLFVRLVPGVLPRQARYATPVDAARVVAKPTLQLQSTPEHPVLSAALSSTLGYHAGVATKAGSTQAVKAKISQDDFSATHGLILVCDGHGKSGEVVSRKVTQVLPPLIFRALSGTATEANIRSAFLATDEEIKKLGPLSGRAGSTAVAVLIAPPKLLTAYVGDSFAILGRRVAASYNSGVWAPVPLVGMHKPHMPQEAERILAAGGKLTTSKNGAMRVNGLALSRAFGDFDDKNAGVIAEPDVNVYDIGPSDEVVIVGSDGVWDVLEESEVLALLEPYWTRRDAEGGAKAIVEAARSVWQTNPSGYRDDITCVVAWLQ